MVLNTEIESGEPHQKVPAKDLEHICARLKGELESLEKEEESGADDRRTVELDQQSVGRLSRMDAIQRQAMAQARSRRRAARRQRILAALARIDEGEFGYCMECGEAVEPARIDLDPTTPLCLDCARR